MGRLAEESPLAGRTVEDAGLRHLTGLYLVEIQRHGAVLPAPGRRDRAPEVRIMEPPGASFSIP